MPDNGGKRNNDKSDAAQAGRDIVLDFFNLILIVVLVAFFFLDIILRGQVFFAGDIMNVYTPWQQYNQEALAAGRMPLWCDDFFMGFPLFAESQGALFYPPTRLVYFFIKGAQAFSYDVLLHFLLAAWFQYFFARSLRLAPWASLLSAVAFAFSGLLLSLPINFTIFRSIVWIPLIFTFVTLGARRGSMVFPLLAAVAIVCQMMGGSLQVTGITFLALIPYVFFLVLSPGHGKQADAVPILQFVLMVMLTFGLYAFQLLPTWELMQYAWRGGQGWEVASAFSFPPEHFIDTIMPTFFGSYADGTMLPVRPTANFFPYVGLVPLLLLVPSLGAKKRGVFILFLLVVLFLALAVGKYGPIYPAVYSTVPFFDKFRAPDRFWMIAVFAGTVLAGFGLERLVNDVESGKKGFNPSAAGLLTTLLILAILFVLGALYTPFVRSIWNSGLDALAGMFLGPGRPGLDPLVYQKWQGSVAMAALHALGVVTVFHLALSLFGYRGRGGVLAGAILLIAIADLYFMSFNVPALRTTGEEFFTQSPRSAQVLMRDGEPNRFYSFLKQYYARELFEFDLEDDSIWYNGGGSNNVDDYYALREALSPNIFMHWGLTSSNGFASLFLARYFELEGAANQQLLPFLEGADFERDEVDAWADQTLLVDLMASRYVLTPIPFVDTDRFSLIDDGPMRIYRNRKALPRAWIARPQAVLGESRDAIQRLGLADINPTRQLILDPIPSDPRTFPDGADGEATARIRPIGGVQGAGARGGAVIDEQVLIEVSTPQPAYLVLADTFYPGWCAEVNAVPVDTIYRAFGYFRAIEIPPGDNLVRFYYRPQSFRTGLTLTLVTVGVFVLILLVQLIFFAKQPPRGTAGGSKSRD